MSESDQQPKPNEKIIFLDIDGVLTTSRSVEAEAQGLIPTQFDPLAIAMLNKMCADTPAKLVIASAWLMYEEMESESAQNKKVRHVLQKAGLNLKHLHHDWRIDDPGNSGRGPSIARWCESHGIGNEGYVVFDDNGQSLSHVQKTRLIRPHPHEGLLLEHCWNGSEMLGGEGNPNPVQWGIRLV